MVRPRINGPGKKRKTYQRRAVEYAHKRDVLDYIDSGHSLDETISQFYGDLSGSDIRAKKKQIHKWSKQAPTIRAAWDSGRGCHRNLRGLGEATVLTKEAERAIVVWVNSLRKDGAPVSRLMLQLQAKEAAADIGLEGKFAATSTWVKLFLRRHKLALRARTRQGQTTPQDAQDAATTFRALVLQTIVEKKCVQVYNADQTGVNFELRGLWINRLRDQLVAYRAKEKQRQEKRDKLQRDIIRVRKDLVQEEAESERSAVMTRSERATILEWLGAVMIANELLGDTDGCDEEAMVYKTVSNNQYLERNHVEKTGKWEAQRVARK
ncbi:hypothetical protein PInf_003417 [Phytophthora infestans]|nr:hypothetical protein PInf_003417 [Phytophthora infestans]